MYWQIIMAGELMEKIYLDEQTLDKWSEIAVPNVDLFFFETIDEIRNYMPSESFFIPRSEFNEHGSYQTIDIINSYQLWAVSKKANMFVSLRHNCFQPLIWKRKWPSWRFRKG